MHWCEGMWKTDQSQDIPQVLSTLFSEAEPVTALELAGVAGQGAQVPRCLPSAGTVSIQHHIWA